MMQEKDQKTAEEEARQLFLENIADGGGAIVQNGKERFQCISKIGRAHV